MWRLSLFLFLFFATIIGGMLLWQWNGYSEQEQLAEEENEVIQSITVKVEKNVFHVTQVVEGIRQQKEYRLDIPNWMNEWKCLYEDGTNCESMDENPSSFLPKDGKMEIHYSFHMKDKNSLLIEGWIPTFPELNILETTIEIIDEDKEEGMWIAGLPLKGHQDLEYIDYYVFQGEREAPALYWEKGNFDSKKIEDKITIFIETETKVNFDTLYDQKDLKHPTDLTVVLTDSYSETISNGILITSPEIKKDQLVRKVIKYYVQEKGTDISRDEVWIFDVFASLFLNKESEYEKGNELIDQLKHNFSEEELEQIVDNVINRNEPLTIEQLDDTLGKIKNKETKFFSLNKNRETKTVPLYFIDPRKINISTGEEEIRMIYFNDERLFPFVETLEQFGYLVTIMEKEKLILVSDSKRSFRFYLEEDRFILNEEDYGLIENPIIQLNGKLYMKDEWLKTIFHISMKEKDDVIILSK